MLPFNFCPATPFFCLLALLLFPAHASSTTHPKPSTYIVPGNSTFPEGIARQPNSPYFYVGSVTTGEIFRGNIYEPKLSLFINGSSYGIAHAVGMKATTSGHLIIAAGTSGMIFVFDIRTKNLLHRFSNGVKTQTRNGTLVNDLDVADDGTVYATDTALPVVYRITPQELENPEVDLPLQSWADLNGTMGGGGNGIVVTKGARFLLVADIYAGEIWRVEISTRKAVKVDFGGAVIGAPDGLLLRHQYLYSVNALYSIGQFIQVIEITAPYLEGKLVRRITSPLFEKPSTAAFDGKDLLVVNFQFSDATPPPPPVLPFTVVRVPNCAEEEGI